jgi:C_GCAxxG_C_C family probable redox protein
MKTEKDPQHHSCNYKCNRRSFVIKSAASSLSISLFSSSFISAFAATVNSEKSKEEIHKQLDELVEEYFPQFGTCSQTSFYALNKVFKLKADKIVKGLTSFPGIALRGETCGAVTGSLLAIGLVYEENMIDKEKKRLSRQPSFKFCSEFEKEFSSTRCRDVIEHVSGKKYNITKPEDYIQLGQDGVYSYCPTVVKKAVHIAADIIFEKE